VASRAGICRAGVGASAHEPLHLLERDLAIAIGVHMVEDPVMGLLELLARQGAVTIGIHDREHDPHHAAVAHHAHPRAPLAHHAGAHAPLPLAHHLLHHLHHFRVHAHAGAHHPMAALPLTGTGLRCRRGLGCRSAIGMMCLMILIVGLG
jgi:hypothetical protein